RSRSPRDLPEARDVGAHHVIVRCSELLGGLAATPMDVAHNVLQPLVGLGEAPTVPAGVLLHLQCRRGYATRVRRLAGAEHDAGVAERFDGFGRARHVGALGDGHYTVLDHHLGIGAVQLVLRSTGEGHFARDLPDARALLEVGPGAVLDVRRAATAPDLLQFLDHVQVEAVRVVDTPAGVAARHHVCTQVLELLDRIDGHVA